VTLQLEAISTPTRPVLRWHGGKWRLGAWIISHFPAHRVYVEPFGGAASVLLQKERSYAEVYNDLDDEVVTLFRVLRDPKRSARLIELLRLTPFGRTEFEESCYTDTQDEIERSRKLIVRAFQGFATCALRNEMTGFRSNTRRSGTTPASGWAGYPNALELAIKRLSGVVIENRDASLVMRDHDGADTLFYVDPPYLPETRSRRANKKGKRIAAYRHELDRSDHAELLKQLRGLGGMVVLSGYPDVLYDETLVDWCRVEIATYADGARPRTEVLWLNPACVSALDRGRLQGQLFAAGGT
jgi:DNA adenine methylase